MYSIATAIATVLLFTSLVTSGPVKQFVPRALADNCHPLLKTCSLYMSWHIASTSLYDQATPLKNMEQPKDLVITDRSCIIVPSSMNQPKAQGPITIYMKGKVPDSLTVNGSDGQGRPLFTYGNKDFGGEDCGWNNKVDTSYICYFDCAADF